MKNNSIDVLDKNWSALTGVSLVVMAILAGVGYGYAYEEMHSLSVSDSFLPILKPEGFIRIFLLCFVGIILLDIIVSWALYHLFHPFIPALTQLMAWLRLLYTAILASSLFPLLDLITNPELAIHNTVVLAALSSFQNAWSMGLIIFGAHLLVLGLIMKRTSLIPSFISYLTLFAGLCYVGIHLGAISFPAFESYQSTVEMVLSLPMALGELGLAVFLIRVAYKKSKINKL